MASRRDFLKLGALFVPALAAPSVVHSFLWAVPSRSALVGLGNDDHLRYEPKRYSRFSVYIDGVKVGQLDGFPLDSDIQIGSGL